MKPVASHYADLLAPIYPWMLGGLDAAVAAAAREVNELAPPGSLAVDLGAGFGAHAIALARKGWRVLAVDSSPVLVEQLRTLAAGLPVAAWCGDLVRFARRVAQGRTADLVLCMGDTLMHLEDSSRVAALAAEVARALAPRGRFVATFRDYSRALAGEERFIPVRSDDSRILTCFLEHHEEHVQVTDLLHERAGATWTMKASSYRKLRLAPAEVAQLFEAAGLRCSLRNGPAGLVVLVAEPRAA